MELTKRGIPFSSISPRFLHTNSTSHTWPFSAVAELIDNAYDPDVSAKQLWIDKTEIKDEDSLILMDNGKGMDFEKMHKMLSFGFNDKQTVRGHVPVGLYGNGFKSGSMRLGKDAIVFSMKAGSMCVGLLSQTYLEKIGAQNIIVPIVKFTKTKQTVSTSPEHVGSLHDILKHSLFGTEEELRSEFSIIESLCGNSSGTRIIIWNLRRKSCGELELDFMQEPHDIRISVDLSERMTETNKCKPQGGMSIPESEYSLRAYCSILYLKPRMKIIIRGLKVETQFVTKGLANVFNDSYKPACHKKAMPITFGYNTKNKEHYGIMMYHKNRLIKAYEHVACQRRANSIGVGVIGVIECNYLNPTHNKQEFDNTEEYRKTMLNVGYKLEDYWKEIRYRHWRRRNCTTPIEETVTDPDQNWVQCDKCQKWRKLPDDIDPKELPKEWHCNMNPNPQFRSCTVEEDPEAYDDEPKYQKTYKQDTSFQLEDKSHRQQSPSTPVSSSQTRQSSTVISSFLTRTQKTTRSQTLVDTQVTSLPSTITRKKRAVGQSHDNMERKKPRTKGFGNSLSDSPSISTASPEAVCSSAMCSSGNNAEKPARKATEIRSNDNVINNSTLKREARYKITQTSSEGQQNYKVLFQQAKEENKQLQYQLSQHEKTEEELKKMVDNLKDEKNSLQKALMAIKRERERVNLSVDRGVQTDFPISPKEESATISTEASITGRGIDLQFGVQQHETCGRPKSGQENKNIQTDRSSKVEEESEDSDDDRPRYQKTYQQELTQRTQQDQDWIKCDKCLKWRKLPQGLDPEKLPKVWFCQMNPDPQFRSCTVEEESGDSDDE